MYIYTELGEFLKNLFVHISFPHLNVYCWVNDFHRRILSLTLVKLLRASFMAKMYSPVFSQSCLHQPAQLHSILGPRHVV